MKKEEFLAKTNEMGIEPEEYRIFPGILVRQPYSYGTYLDEDEWVLYHIDERNSIHEFLRGDENFIFDKLYKFLFATLQLDDYLNNSITVDIVETTKSEVFLFLKKRFLLQDWKLKETWDFFFTKLEGFE